MPYSNPSDIDTTSREIHRVVLDLADSLDEEQLQWRPSGYATSIGFHLWLTLPPGKTERWPT